MDKALLGWIILLGLGFPILSLLLSETIERLSKSQPALASALRQFLRYVLPSLAVLLVMRQLMGVEEANSSSQIVETATWLAIAVASVSFVNAIFTTSDRSAQWTFKVPNLFFQVLRTIIIFTAGLQILGGVWSVDLSGIITAVGVSSLVIALALQDTLSNLVSGLLLLLSKPFKPNDWIIFNGTKGRVIEQNWWGVTLEHRGWEKTITVPNGTLAKATVENFGPDGFWYSVEVEFSYDDPPNRVLDALNRLNQGFEELELDQFLYDLNLYVGIQEFGASGIKYVVWYKRVADRKNRLFKNYFLSRIYHMAQREGFTIPYPISMEYQIEANSGLPERIPKISFDRTNDISSYLYSLPYFKALAQEDVRQLACKVQVRQYGHSEVIIQEGKFDEGLYIIYSGRVQIWNPGLRENSSDASTSLKSGDLFGEMALFPGELSPITAIAETDSEILMIDSSVMVFLIQSKPQFGFEMNRFIKNRRKAFEFPQASHHHRTLNGKA